MTISDPTIEAAKAQTSQGLILQGYCNSILQQSEVNFAGFENLESKQEAINIGLRSAKDNANTYLNGIQPSIITNISNISNFYNLYAAVPEVLPPNATEAQWLSILNAMKQQTDTYVDASQGIVVSLGDLNGRIGEDVSFFSRTISELNALVNGSEGVLASMTNDIKNLDKQIRGTIAGAAISGLTIVGGVVMIGVGSVAGFVTAGTSLALVAGGVVVVTAGVGGAVASAKSLQNLYGLKHDLLLKKSSLNEEVNLAVGIETAYDTLGIQAAEAMSATSQMRNAWTALNGDLDTLSRNLQSGIISTDVLRQLFLKAANETIPLVLEDVSIIKQQMAGVEVTSAGDMNIGEYAVHLAEQSVA